MIRGLAVNEYGGIVPSGKKPLWSRQDEEVMGHSFNVLETPGEGNALVQDGGVSDGPRLRGNYGELATNIPDESGDVAESIAHVAHQGQAPENDVPKGTAMLSRIVDQETKRSATAPATTRLAVVGLRGDVSLEEMFGNAESEQAIRNSGSRDKREARRGAGGLLPQSAKGATRTEKDLQDNLVKLGENYNSGQDPNQKDAILQHRFGTMAEADQQEFINRTVELVHRAVEKESYESIEELKVDIVKRIGEQR